MAFTQANSPMSVTTPLGPDKFLLIEFSGHEAISELFHFQLEVVADNTVVRDLLKSNNAPFSGVLGQPVLVELRLRGRKRHFHGICNRVTQGIQDDIFTAFRFEVVPKMWLLTKRTRSRIFQGLTVPQILEMVLQGTKLSTESRDPTGPALDVKFQFNEIAAFKKRDYCVQYRESDFNFASRPAARRPSSRLRPGQHCG